MPPRAGGITSCYGNCSDRPHHRRRTDRFIVFARWQQFTSLSEHGALGPQRQSAIPNDTSIGSSVFARFAGVLNGQTDIQTAESLWLCCLFYHRTTREEFPIATSQRTHEQSCHRGPYSQQYSQGTTAMRPPPLTGIAATCFFDS